MKKINFEPAICMFESVMCVLFYAAAILTFVAICTAFIEEGDRRAEVVKSSMNTVKVEK